MFFLWLSNNFLFFPLVFVRFVLVFLCVSLLPLWFSLVCICFPMAFLLFSYCFPWFSYSFMLLSWWFTIAFLGYPMVRMVFLCFPFDFLSFPMVFLCFRMWHNIFIHTLTNYRTPQNTTGILWGSLGSMFSFIGLVRETLQFICKSMSPAMKRISYGTLWNSICMFCEGYPRHSLAYPRILQGISSVPLFLFLFLRGIPYISLCKSMDPARMSLRIPIHFARFCEGYLTDSLANPTKVFFLALWFQACACIFR